jgi:hypothetical protein
MNRMGSMGALPPVDRVGGIVPVSRREHPQIPVANDVPHKRHPPAGQGPRDQERDATPEPEMPEAPAVAPAVSPNPTFGNVVNTFAGPRLASLSALLLL